MRAGARPTGAKYCYEQLGWRNFTEGRFVSLYVELQQDYLQGIETYQTTESWGYDNDNVSFVSLVSNESVDGCDHAPAIGCYSTPGHL